MRRHQCKARFSKFYTSGSAPLQYAPTPQYGEIHSFLPAKHLSRTTTFLRRPMARQPHLINNARTPSTSPSIEPRITNHVPLITRHPTLSSSLTYNQRHPSIHPVGGALASGSRTNFQSRVRGTSYSRSYLFSFIRRLAPPCTQARRRSHHRVFRRPCP